MSKVKRIMALAGVITVAGVPAAAQARHGADDPAGHHRHHRHALKATDARNGADDGVRHERHGGDDGPRHDRGDDHGVRR
jgi:hypothetical protein